MIESTMEDSAQAGVDSGLEIRVLGSEYLGSWSALFRPVEFPGGWFL
ncbi:MAG: hypothetical protein NT056_04370 [Proteobacteria bacterium]|nr:hypothetical protein [Pseudomonadota bacterium]